MARRVISLDDKIAEAEAIVIARKEKYDEALDVLKKLLDKRKERDDKIVLDAYHAGTKTADEIISFIQNEASKSVEG